MEEYKKVNVSVKSFEMFALEFFGYIIKYW